MVEIKKSRLYANICGLYTHGDRELINPPILLCGSTIAYILFLLQVYVSWVIDRVRD